MNKVSMLTGALTALLLVSVCALMASDTVYLGKAVPSDLAPQEPPAGMLANQPFTGHLDGDLDCSEAMPIACGEAVIGDNTGFPQNVQHYSCTTRDESGPEVVYEFVLDDSMYVHVVLIPSDGCDLDVFLLDACDENNCLYYGNYDFMTDCLLPGTYYIVVDGHYSDACSYDLAVNCVTCAGPGGPGDDCDDPVMITLPDDMPYADANQTTCGRGNDYDMTCLGDYDEGQDIIYQLTVASPVDVDILIDPGETYHTGICIDDACPPADPCLASATSYGSNEYGLYALHLDPGTYYIMIDNSPSPDCIMWFDLTITEACVVDCPQSGLPEGEPICYDDYEDQFNGGCGSDPIIFNDITCGDVICGTSGTFLYDGMNFRDTDWYELVLAQTSTITWSAAAEFPVLLVLIDAQSGNCSDWIILDAQTAPLCSTATIVAECLPPGLYWLWIGPSVFDGPACGAAYTATASCEPCPGGTIQLSTDHLECTPTYVGESCSVDMIVTNSHETDQLVVNDVTTTGHIWEVEPTRFELPPGGTQPVTVTFTPTFEHDFEGIIEFFSSDPETPRDSLPVSGVGCKPVVIPPAPRLFGAGSPTDIYFAMPWDEANGNSTQYAVEVSSDGFASWGYAQFALELGTDAEYWTARAWGQWGTGLIAGLEPETDYEVRLRARDCTGVEAVGPSASITTAPEVVLESPELTIQLVHPDTAELNWDPVARDINGQTVDILAWAVFAGATPDVVTEFVELSLTGTMRIPITDDAIRFFEVDAIGVDRHGAPMPFISWPPDGATLAGVNSVFLNDFVHQAKWDSFRVEMDISGEPVLLGSSFDNPWDEPGYRAVSANFSQFPEGLHTITATVVDIFGNPWSTSVDINIIPEPSATFDAHYDSSVQEFTVNVEDPQNIGSGYSDIMWPVSAVGERYGDTIRFRWKPTNDSLTVLEPQLKLLDKYLREGLPGVLDPTLPGGVWPDEGETLISHEEIKCCCDTLMLHTSGQSQGNYGWTGGSVALGPQVTCRGRNYRVNFKFEVELRLKYIVADSSQDCYWGQDCKRTDTLNMGRCAGGTFTPVTQPAHLREWYEHREYGGTRYPADTSTYGNDDYRPDRHGTNFDDSQRSQGIVYWFDWPEYRNRLPQNSSGYTWAMRCRRDAKFFARADCECVPDAQDCCLKWELEWDVVFCQDCTIIQNTAPRIFNIAPSASCDSLKPN